MASDPNEGNLKKYLLDTSQHKYVAMVNEIAGRIDSEIQGLNKGKVEVAQGFQKLAQEKEAFAEEKLRCRNDLELQRKRFAADKQAVLGQGMEQLAQEKEAFAKEKMRWKNELNEKEKKLAEIEERIKAEQATLHKRKEIIQNKLDQDAKSSEVLSARKQQMDDWQTKLTERSEKLANLEVSLKNLQEQIGVEQRDLKIRTADVEDREACLSLREVEVAQKAESLNTKRIAEWAPLEEYLKKLSANSDVEMRSLGMRVRKITNAFAKNGASIHIKLEDMKEATLGMQLQASREITTITSGSGSDIRGCLQNLCHDLLRILRTNHPGATGRASVTSFQPYG